MAASGSRRQCDRRVARPRIASCGGYDLSASAAAVIPRRGRALVKTDLFAALPEGTYGRIAPRSGLAWKHFLDTGAGVIDQTTGAK